MLMVIFGAGASYDSVEAVRPGAEPARILSARIDETRPPLADELFDDRPLFIDKMIKYRDCMPPIPRLRRREDGMSVEDIQSTGRERSEAL